MSYCLHIYDMDVRDSVCVLATKYFEFEANLSVVKHG